MTKTAAKRVLFLLIALLLLSTSNSHAAFVPENTAQGLARHFFQRHIGALPQAELLSLATSLDEKSNLSLRSAQDSLPLFYVFNLPSKGFILISAHDNVRPVLGYSFSSSFDADTMPDNVAHHLAYYREAIQYALDNDIPASPSTQEAWDRLKSNVLEENQVVVPPLLSSTWGQDYPFNSLCPFDESVQKRSLTGCVATAMAALFYYWKYPSVGYGEKSYELVSSGTLSAHFDAAFYDYESMNSTYKDSSYTQAQLDAVSLLMYHCGLSVEMQYSPHFSGSYSLEYYPDCPSAEYALNHYFGYESAVGKEKTAYTDSAWMAMIKNELYYARPVFMGGGNSDNTLSHAFICDGYDNLDYFHFNWGWEGYYDGYFLMNNLNPGNLDFNYMQEAIVQIQPSHLNDSIFVASPRLHFNYPDDTLQSIDIRGVLLTDSIHVSSQAPFYVSSDSLRWQTSLKLSLRGDRLFVRYIPEEENIHLGEILLSSGDNVQTLSVKGNFIVCHPDTLPFFEDFEDSLGLCWHQEYVQGEQDWICQNGGNVYPPKAHRGVFNAYFKHQTKGNATKLVSSELQLPLDKEIWLSFWHVHQRWNQDSDNLRVYYKNHPDSTWTLLKEYNNSVAIWTKDSLLLPQASERYWVAFEATDNYGYGVNLDDISIQAFAPAVPPDTTFQDTVFVTPPSNVQCTTSGDSLLIFSWVENDTASRWEFAFDTAGFVPDSVESMYTSSTSCRLPYPLPNRYDFYVRSVVSDSLVSDWVGPLRLNTRIVYVRSERIHNGINDGSSWEKAFSQVQTAIDSAAAQQPPARVWIAQGTYHPTAFHDNEEDLRMRSFIMRQGVNIYGGFKGDESRLDQRQRQDLNGDSIVNAWEFSHQTILSGDFYENDSINYTTYAVKNNTENAYRVIHCPVKGITIDGCCIKGGYANHISQTNYVYAAAIYADSCLLINNIIEQNISNSSLGIPIYGGAIYQEKGSLVHCLIRRNISQSNTTNVYGGAIFNNKGVIDHCEIYNNIGYSTNDNTYGGGVYNEKTALVNHCLIYNNSAISHLRYGHGGGIYNNDYNTRITHSTVVHNQADEYSAVHSGDISYCILEGEALQGLYHNNAICNQGSVKNDSNSLYLFWEDLGFALPSSFSGAARSFLMEKELNSCDWTLTAHSACLDKHLSDSLLINDLDLAGHPRLYGEAIDLGAYEYTGYQRPVNGVTLLNNHLILYLYQQDTLQVDISPRNAHDKRLIFTNISNHSAIDVDSFGVVSSLKKGLDTVVVQSWDRQYSDTCQIVVYHKQVDSIHLSPDSLQLGIGDSLKLEISVYPTNASNRGYTLTYYGDSAIELSDKGFIKGIKEGCDTVVVFSYDDIHSDTCIVRVQQIKVQSVSLSKDSMNAFVNDTLQLQAQVWPRNSTNDSVYWYSSDTSIASVDSLGRVVALNTGQVNIFVVSIDGLYRDSCRFNIFRTIPVEGVSLNMDTLLMYKRGFAVLLATVIPDLASNKKIRWSSLRPDIVSIDALSGNMYAYQTGETYIYVHTEDGHFSDSCLIKVFVLDDLSSENPDKIDLYPNPTFSRSFISGIKASDRISLWSMDGRLLKRLRWEDGQENSLLEISMEAFPKGIYLLKIQREDKLFIQKIVKQ